MRAFAVLAAVCLTPLSGAVAQEQTATGSALCFRGAPQARCRSFLLVEFGAWYRLDPPFRDDQRYAMTTRLGWMRNVTAKDALGVAAYGTVTGHASDADFVSVGALLRYRRWLGGRSAVELGIGMPFGGNRSLGDIETPSPFAEIRWSHGDLLAVSAKVERLLYRKGYFGSSQRLPWTSGCCAVWWVEVPDAETAWYLGAEFGSYPGIVGILVGVGITILDMLANISS